VTIAAGFWSNIDRVLENARDAAVIFWRDEQHAVRGPDLVAQADPLLGRILVEVLIVERQVADLDDRAL
jgi:hypothetical protein